MTKSYLKEFLHIVGEQDTQQLGKTETKEELSV